VRSFVVVAILALSSLGVIASQDAVVTNDTAAELASPAVVTDTVVTVSPIPMPARVTELLHEVSATKEIRQAKKLKVAKKKSLPTAMFSRTERHQMALLAASQKTEGALVADFFNDEDFESGIDKLDLHRSFSRPKVMELADQDEECADDGEDLSEAIKLRLFLARMKAVRAHENKFS